jgi:hypothetical protein
MGKDARFVFPTLTFHCALIAVVFAIAVFRFFLTGKYHCKGVEVRWSWAEATEQRREGEGGGMELGNCSSSTPSGRVGAPGQVRGMAPVSYGPVLRSQTRYSLGGEAYGPWEQIKLHLLIQLLSLCRLV